MDRLNTAQKITVGFGVVYLLVGILGFIPGVVTPASNLSNLPNTGLLLGLFGVNLLHNLSHLLFGVIFIAGGLSRNWVGPVNRVMFGVFVLLVLATFIDPLVNGLALNLPDLVLHLGSALLTGYLGFVATRDDVTTDTPAI